MSEKEQLKQVIDRLPDYKLAYVASLIMNIEKTDIEEIEPDEWDLQMLNSSVKIIWDKNETGQK